MGSIMITGGAGYLGRPLCQRLLNVGHEVVSLDKGIFGHAQVQQPRFAQIPADIRLSEIVGKAMENVDAVIHMAFINGASAVKAEPRVASHINLIGTRNVIEEADKAGVPKLIIISDALPTGEEASGDTGDVNYARQRTESLFSLSETPGMERTVLNLPMLCGWSPRMRFDLLVNRIVAEAVMDGIAAEPTTKTTIPVLHVQDAVTAIKLVLDSPVTHGLHNFDVGGEEVDLRDVVSILKKMNSELKVAEGPSSRQSFKVDGSEFKEKYSFGRSVTVEDGVKEIIQGLVQSRGAVKWTDPIYHNRKMGL